VSAPAGALSQSALQDCRRAVEATLASVGEPMAHLAHAICEGTFRRIVFTGEGCSYTAEIACAPALKRFLPIPCDVIAATELSVYPALVDEHTCVVVLSRTGQRRFVLDALARAKERGATVIAITGNPAGGIVDVADQTIATHEGPEPAYLKSKSTLAGISAILALIPAISDTDAGGLRLGTLERLPELVERGLALAQADMQAWLPHASGREHWAFLGSGPGYGAAADAALKAQETALVHASAHSLGFFYHGPLGAVTDAWGAFVLATHAGRDTAEIVVRELVRAQAAPVLVLAPETLDIDLSSVHRLALADPVTTIGASLEVAELLAPLTQLPALYTCVRALALARGLNPDVPPNMEHLLQLILPPTTVEPDLEPATS
jgi:glucosamine--fructose-6-phosphate aminotransferase (isomerizing)